MSNDATTLESEKALIARLIELTHKGCMTWNKHSSSSNTYTADYKDSTFELSDNPRLSLVIDYELDIEADWETLSSLLWAVQAQISGSRSSSQKPYNRQDHLKNVLEKISTA